MMKTISMKSRS